MAEALLQEDPVVEIAGRRYQLQPLGLSAKAPLARMVLIAQKHTGITARDLAQKDADGLPVLDADGDVHLDPTVLIRLFTAAIGYAEPEVDILLSKLLAVSMEDLRDPKRFPLSCGPQLLAALISGIDVAAFLAAMQQTGTEGREPGETPSPSEELLT